VRCVHSNGDDIWDVAADEQLGVQRTRDAVAGAVDDAVARSGAACRHQAHNVVGGVRVGVDVADIARFDTLVAGDSAALRRCFSARELAAARRRRRPGASLAGMWAAKEAWCKATSTSVLAAIRGQLEVVHDPCGAPRLERGGVAVPASVSIAHDGPVAVAVVLVAAD
jgi:holo-[acyl-carrier protein] synthase